MGPYPQPWYVMALLWSIFRATILEWLRRHQDQASSDRVGLTLLE
jgi:hypothetical protein